MTLSTLLSSLRTSARRLQKSHASIVHHERTNNTNPLIMLPPPNVEIRTAFNNAYADLSLATTLTVKYQSILAGRPLEYDIALPDQFTASILEHGEDIIAAHFMNNDAGGTGLEYYLCGQDSGSGSIEEWASEEEVFATYRAIGCMSFTEFEIAVHRIVWRAEEAVMAVKFLLGAAADDAKENVKVKGEKRKSK